MTLDDKDNLELLEALAKVSARDFRLGQFMSDIGLDPNQTNLFYRQLIREAKEIMSLIEILEQNIDTHYKAISQLKTQLSAQIEQTRTLTVKLRSLEGQTYQKTESLDNERRQLLATNTELQAKVLRYDAITQLLIGKSKPPMLKAMSDLYFSMYEDAVNAVAYGQSPPDPARLEKVRQNLRQEFRDILQIPKQELEQEMDKLRAENEKLLIDNKTLAAMNWRDYLQWLEDKRRNETTEGGG